MFDFIQTVIDYVPPLWKKWQIWAAIFSSTILLTIAIWIGNNKKKNQQRNE